MRCIPQDEYIAYQTLVNEAGDVWHRAKEENDYAAFEPYLAQIVETNIRFAGYIAPDKHPYDYWLDQYEGGLTMEKCDAFLPRCASGWFRWCAGSGRHRRWMIPSCTSSFPRRRRRRFPPI